MWQRDQSVETRQHTRRFRWISCGILLALGMVLYGFTVSYPFVFDDHVYLVENPLVKEARSFAFVRNVRAFVAAPGSMGLDPDLSTNFILRPFAYLTFHLNYVLDGLRPRGYRAVNIVIHCLNAILIFLILEHMLRVRCGRGNLSSGSVYFIALGTALLFVCHPLQIESVTYIIQRFTSLGAFFYLLTILLHLLANDATTRKRAILLRFGSVAALVLGMLTKEESFTAPFVLVLLDWLVVGTPLKMAFKRATAAFCCLPIIPSLVLVTSFTQSGGALSLTGAIHIVNPHAYSSWQYALTQLSVVMTYLKLILFPVGLNLDWEYALSNSWREGRVLISLMLMVTLIGGAWVWYRIRRTDVRLALIFVSVVWYFVALAISSSVIPLPDLLSEHRSYLATVGAICAVICCLDLLRCRLADWPRLRWAVPTVTFTWAVILSAATVSRNQVWRSEVSIWKDTALKSPHKARVWNNLGVAYCEAGQPQEGIACFRKLLELDPTFIRGYQNLGAALHGVRQYQEALIVSENGLRRAPHYEPLYYNLGMAYLGLNQTNQSIEAFTRALAIRPTHLLSHIWLTGIYANLRQFDLAWKHCQTAASLSPSDPRIHQMMRRLEPLANPPMGRLTLNLSSTHEPVRIP